MKMPQSVLAPTRTGSSRDRCVRALIRFETSWPMLRERHAPARGSIGCRCAAASSSRLSVQAALRVDCATLEPELLEARSDGFIPGAAAASSQSPDRAIDRTRRDESGEFSCRRRWKGAHPRQMDEAEAKIQMTYRTA
jgi:hypothetical protein